MSSQRQTIHSIHNKKFWTEFFYLYESLPAIWDTNNPLYKNRQVKYDSYDIMVDKLKQIEPNASREDVLRKINIFRTNFRRECSRINASLEEGRHYQSTLWYFDLLSFLQTSDMRRDKKRKVDDDGEKSIMRKRRHINIMQRPSDQCIPSKNEDLVEYQPLPTNRFEYDLEDEQDFNYVPEEIANALVGGKNDGNSETQENPLSPSNYQGVVEEDHSQQGYHHQEDFHNYTLQSNDETNDKSLKLTAGNVRQIGDENKTNGISLHINAADTEKIKLQTKQTGIKTANSENTSSLKLEESNINVGKTLNTFKLNDNASTKFVRDVKTMTSNNSNACGCSKLSESSEILAKSWAVQYDELSQDQKLWARKAINDILFEGCMGHLSIGSNGRVIIYGVNYKSRLPTKVSSSNEVESSEIYEKSIIASSTFPASGEAAGTSTTLSTSAVATPRAHESDEWL